jgi:hypothetical protein
MNFQLQYSGADGNLSATLICNGKTIATTTGLTDKKAVEKWADRLARDYKVESTPEATAEHYVSVSGTKTFSL